MSNELFPSNTKCLCQVSLLRKLEQRCHHIQPILVYRSPKKAILVRQHRPCMNSLPRYITVLYEVGKILENGFMMLREKDFFQQLDYFYAVIFSQIVESKVALSLNQCLDELNVVRNTFLLQLLHRLEGIKLRCAEHEAFSKLTVIHVQFLEHLAGIFYSVEIVCFEIGRFCLTGGLIHQLFSELLDHSHDLVDQFLD